MKKIITNASLLTCLQCLFLATVAAQNVGIGTAAPTSLLHVEQTSSAPVTPGYFKLTTTATSGISAAIYGDASGNGVGSYRGVYGRSGNTGTGSAVSVEGFVDGSNSGAKVGVEGISNGSAGTNFGTRGWAIGTSTGVNYGLYGSAYGGASNWAAYLESGNVYIQNNLGIGTSGSPVARLEVSGSSAGQAAVMQLTVSSGTGHGIRSNIQSATPVALGNPSAILGDAGSGNGIAGTSTSGTGAFGYSVSGTGVFGTSTTGSAVKGFSIGSGIGGEFYNNGGGPALIAGNGNVGIGTYAPSYKLDAVSTMPRTGNFDNSASTTDNFGLYASCYNTPYYGLGIKGQGGFVGVDGSAELSGAGNRFALRGYASGGAGSNYGIYGSALGGSSAYGIFATATGGTTNYAGYFNGNVYCSGTYLPSDRKLKNDIRELKDALTIIEQLNPSVYTYKTNEYEQMRLPAGQQYGLIADEVQQVLPGAVTKAIQPAVYSDRNEKGTKLKDELTFNAVNYTMIIPVLIAAVKEQQAVISSQQKKIAEVEERLSAVEKK